MISTKNHLEKLKINQLLDLSEFVVTENFKHHSNNILPENYKTDVNSIYKEEVNYFNDSEVFVSKDASGSISGSIRVLRWNYKDMLPIQKIFGINPLLVTGDENVSINDVWHIGRFAIKKEVKDINLFKQLMVCAISPICKHKGNIAFAECDSKLLRILNLLGIKATVIGNSINYLGSETIPILMTYDGLIDFYTQNIGLVPTNVLNQSTKNNTLQERVVFTKQTLNYPLV